MPTLPKITNGNLTEMHAIAAGHPVYRVKIGGADFSLKAESSGGGGASSDVKWASKIMHNVVDGKTDTTKVRLLEEGEIDVIANRYGNFNLTDPQKIVLEDTLTMGDNVWYIMHWQPGLFNPSDNMGNPQIDQLFDTINHGAFWKKLGKIISVDLFTGNNDRFDFANYQNATPQDFWSNKGNLFINVSNINNGAPIGLDFFFNQNAFGKDIFGDQAYIAIMKSKNEVDRVATLIISSIMDALAGKSLGKKTGKVSKVRSFMSTKLKGYSTTAEKYQGYLTNSIWEGHEELKKYLILKRKEYANATPAQQPVWQNNPMNQRVVPNLRNNIPQRPGNTAPVAHNNAPVGKKVFPANIETRMRAIGWIQ